MALNGLWIYKKNEGKSAKVEKKILQSLRNFWSKPLKTLQESLIPQSDLKLYCIEGNKKYFMSGLVVTLGNLQYVKLLHLWLLCGIKRLELCCVFASCKSTFLRPPLYSTDPDWDQLFLISTKTSKREKSLVLNYFLHFKRWKKVCCLLNYQRFLPFRFTPNSKSFILVFFKSVPTELVLDIFYILLQKVHCEHFMWFYAPHHKNVRTTSER